MDLPAWHKEGRQQEHGRQLNTAPVMSIVERMDEREVAKRMEEEEQLSRIKDNEDAYALQVGCDLHPDAGGELVSMTRCWPSKLRLDCICC